MSDVMSTGHRQSLAMKLLEAGVPLSLLLDLTAPEGPDSASISARERPDN